MELIRVSGHYLAPFLRSTMTNRSMSISLPTDTTIPWVGTRNGVCRFDGESFVPFPTGRAFGITHHPLSPLLEAL